MEKKWIDRVIDMIFRGVLGLVIIYILQVICIQQNFPVLAGVNLGVFSLIAMFGMPGFMLVLAIGLIGIY